MHYAFRHNGKFLNSFDINLLTELFFVNGIVGTNCSFCNLDMWRYSPATKQKSNSRDLRSSICQVWLQCHWNIINIINTYDRSDNDIVFFCLIQFWNPNIVYQLLQVLTFTWVKDSRNPMGWRGHPTFSIKKINLSAYTTQVGSGHSLFQKHRLLFFKKQIFCGNLSKPTVHKLWHNPNWQNRWRFRYDLPTRITTVR